MAFYLTKEGGVKQALMKFRENSSSNPKSCELRQA